MKRKRAVESDSVKSARKAKDNLHKAYQRVSCTFCFVSAYAKLAHEFLASMRETRDGVLP